jgi:hypothetical protein
VHCYGEAQPDVPEQWQPDESLHAKLGPTPPHSVYRFVDSRRRDVGRETWSLSAVQTCAVGEPAHSRMGKRWYDRQVGVRITMLGGEPTTACFARTPDTLGLRSTRVRPPQPEDKYALPQRDKDYDAADRQSTELDLLPLEHEPGGDTDEEQPVDDKAEAPAEPDYRITEPQETGGVSIIAHRRAPSTTFVAVHEPFERGRWSIDRVRRIARAEPAMAVAVRGRGRSVVNDRVLIATGGQCDRPITLAGEGETYTFTGFAFVRIGDDRIVVEGNIDAMALPVKGKPKLTINGGAAAATYANGTISYEK